MATVGSLHLLTRRYEVFAWIFAPVACHAGYSWIGFNPTDDGWLQAVARRLIEGEVPHRDFIFVRPALSALLQIPVVLLGGDYAIWWSRLWGWLGLGFISWTWTTLLAREMPFLSRYLGYVLVLLLCAHTFPVMAWHTIDAVVFCSLATWLLVEDTPRRRRLAFFLAGLAVLCRQNFAFFPPLLLLAVGGRPLAWASAGFWSVLPTGLYIGGIAALSGARDFFEQLWSNKDALFSAAITRYTGSWRFWVALATGLGLSVWLKVGRPSNRFGSAAAAALFATLTLFLAWGLWQAPSYYSANAIALFGLAVGLTVVALLPASACSKSERLAFVSLLALAWVCAISRGYNNPGLLSGALALGCWRLFHTQAGAPFGTRMSNLCLLGSALVVTLVFSHARRQFPYRDRPAHELGDDAGLAVKGASGLLTNKLTFHTLLELRQWAERFEDEGRRVAVLTDCPLIWIRSRSRNPLPCEWPQGTELGYNPVLVDRMLTAIRDLPPESRILVQKYLICEYSWAFMPVPGDDSFYFVQHWVANHCVKVSETSFFTIYAPPVFTLGSN